MHNNLVATGLSEQVIKKIHTVFSHHAKVMLVMLYGSRAKGNFHPGSDIDLTIIGDNLDFSELLKIENQLDDLLLAYKIDISLYQNIKNKDLIDHIQRVGIIFYQNINDSTKQKIKKEVGLSIKQLDAGESISINDVFSKMSAKYE